MKAYFVPTKLFLFSTLLATAIECGGEDGGMTSNMSTIKGRVSDNNGSQPQSLKILSGKFGGAGSISAATKVRVSRLKTDGTLDSLAEATVTTGGRYELAAPAGQKRLIVESVDVSGTVLASAIVEISGEVGQAVTVAPLDTETSVEAAVLARMAASGVALAELNAIDLRERINLNVAVAVSAATDADVKIKALAEAVLAAQSAKVKAYAAAGITTSQSALFDAQLAAAKKLDIALDAAVNASAMNQAYVDFHTELDAGLMALDASLKKHARAESVASVAFRAMVKARLSVAGDAVADASLRAAAALEARISAAAVASILTSAQASAQATTAAATAATTLRAQMTASASATASAMAFGAWSTSLNGGATITGSVLGNYLEVTAANAATVQAAVTATTMATAALDLSLKATASMISATGTLDYNVLAQSIVTAYSAYQTAIDMQLTALVAFGAKAQTALDVMATVSGSFRLQ